MTAKNAAPASAYSVAGEGLIVSHGGRVVLDVPSISIAAGETYALLGASGAGKSTLLRVLGLLEKPKSGRVLLDGNAVSRRSLPTRRRISAVFQKPYLLRGTVADNAGYGLRLRHISSAERRARVASALRIVGLGGWEDRSALTLSGGEAQRVALARALVLEPSLLLLDEPLSYLDPLLKRSLSVEFAEILASERITALYVSHDQDEAAVVADRIAVMRDGRIVAEGTPDDVLGMPEDDWVAAFVDMEPPLRARVVAASGGVATLETDGVRLTLAHDLPAGSTVAIAVRPEDVMLTGPNAPVPDGHASLEGVVASVTPRGASVRYVVERGGQRVAASVSRAVAAQLELEAGSPARAVFAARAVRVRPENGSVERPN